MNRFEGEANGPVVQAATIHGGVHIHGSGPARRPNGLPVRAGLFLNRRDELDAFDGMVAAYREERRSLAFAITGYGGVGKTALAVHWAHEASGKFRDGVVYADLGGSAETGPVPVGVVLAILLRQLGVERIPKSDEEKLAAYRARTADSELLVVLDDAATMAQVTAARPSSPRSMVLVTCRQKLTGFGYNEIESTRLDPLAEDVATDLVSRLVGDGLSPDDRHELTNLVAVCGGLPLALRIAAIQLRENPRGLVARLGAERDRLASLAVDEERLVDAVFDAGYLRLDEETARAYRLLALWDGPSFDVAAAAALLDRDPETAETLLRQLVRVYLLGVEDGRYGFHSLIRLHGRDRAEQAESVDDRRAAMGRMVRHFRDYWIARDKALSARPRACEDVYAEIPVVHEGDSAAALADLERERENLLAAVLVAKRWGFDDYAWHMGVASFPFYFQRGHYEDWISTHEVALEAAVGQDRALIQLHNQLGTAHFELDENVKALKQYQLSLDLAVKIGDPMGQQTNWEWLGFIWERREQYEKALHSSDMSRALVARWPANKQPRAFALYNMNSGRVLVEAGRLDEALPRLAEAKRFFLAGNDVVNVAKTDYSIGKAYGLLGRAAEAVELLEPALAVLTEQGSLAWQESLHESLAEAYRQLGRDEDADRHHAEKQRLNQELTQRRDAVRRLYG
ncbi:NB-ARC domain-containing protein [Kutzneria sp. NPDC052558]|uniref:NB-ARC domain-containing protein n=1 Tax=Kutzneria sp. NPDC052558 TaxID=3364121 RepID=UPI0037C8820A